MIYSAFGPEVYDSYPTSPYPIRQFQGEMGYDRDLPNLNYARNRYVDTVKGRWISRDPIGSRGVDWNVYRYVQNNPVNASDPNGKKTQQVGSRPSDVIPTPDCPYGKKPDDSGDYAMACSNNAVTRISASFTTPSMCNLEPPDGYINFYLSVGGYEAGVSFSAKHNGWNVFINCQQTPPINDPTKGTPIFVGAPIGGGQTVNMAMTILAADLVQFTIGAYSQTCSGPNPFTEGGYQAKLVNAASKSSQNARCPNAHSAAVWSNITVDQGGMQSNASSLGTAEVIDSNSFSSHLRHATSPCDKSQFEK